MKKYKSLRDFVRSYISEEIYAGSLKPGDRINEQSLAAKLGVSRTPAREALMQLEAEGLLEYAPRKGFSIKQISGKETRDNYEVLALLDAYAATCALPQMSPDDLAALKECIDKIDVAIKYKNRNDYRLLQHQFHDLYRRRCGNHVVLRVLEMMESGLTPEVFVSDDTERLFTLYGAINDEHRRIVELMENKESDQLFRYLKDHHWALDRDGAPYSDLIAVIAAA